MTVAHQPSLHARAAADRSANGLDAAVAMLADLVAFRTVARPPRPNAALKEFRRCRDYLFRRARGWGFDVADHGAALVIGLGRSPDRLGLLTHADVQPADAARWRTDPFVLDTATEAGRLIGRGVEDDKSSIVTACYAMQALRQSRVPLRRRVELIVSLTEETDWEPFRQFLREWPPPALNVALDAVYPVVTAEKGSGGIELRVSPVPGRPAAEPRHLPGRLTGIRGGDLRTQIPASAEATIERPAPGLADRLGTAVDPAWGVAFEFVASGDRLQVRTRGRAAHSSMPDHGRNAVTHLAAVLGPERWPVTPASCMVRLINDLIGLGHRAERFGALAHQHPMMGPLTLSLTTLHVESTGAVVAGFNLRRPVGRTPDEVRAAIDDAIGAWQRRTGVAGLHYSCRIGEPYYLESAPHVPALLNVYRFYTGQRTATAVAVGGGTQARLLPNGVNFGPAMPGARYTGHSDHEFITIDQFRLNLRMCAAAVTELAAAG